MMTVVFRNGVAVGYVNGTAEDAQRVVTQERYNGNWALACRDSNIAQIYTFKELREMQ